MDPSPAEVPEEVGGAPAGDGFVRPLSAADIAAGQAMLRAAFPQPAAPPLANAAYAGALDQPLRFRYPGESGTPFHVKPLAYVTGLRLYALARRFADARAALPPESAAEFHRPVTITEHEFAVVGGPLFDLLLPLVTPSRAWDRLRLRISGIHPLVAGEMNAITTQLLLDQLLGLPDEIARRLPLIEMGQTLPPIDCLDDLGRFVQECPAWVGRDGYPLSWRHYRLGTQVRARAEARWALITYQAVGMAQAETATQRTWIDRMRAQAGMN